MAYTPIVITGSPILLYDNRFADATPTATTAATGYAASNVADWRTNTAWQATSLATQYLTVDCGTAKTASALAIVGHNFYPATVSVECSTDNFSADTTVALAGFSVTSNDIIIKQFAQLSKRYWRLKIVSPLVNPSAKIVVLGDPLLFEYPIEGDFSPANESIDTNLDGSAGQLLAATRYFTALSSSVNFVFVRTAWFRELFMPAWTAWLAVGRPFIWAHNLTSKPNDAFLYRMATSYTLGSAYFGVALRNLSLSFQGLKVPVSSSAASKSVTCSMSAMIKFPMLADAAVKKTIAATTAANPAILKTGKTITTQAGAQIIRGRTTSISSAVQKSLSVSASASAQLIRARTASLGAALSKPMSAPTTIGAALQRGRSATTSASANIIRSRILSANVAVQKGRSITTGCNAQLS